MQAGTRLAKTDRIFEDQEVSQGVLSNSGAVLSPQSSVLHPHYRLFALDQVGVVDETLVDVELRHIVDNDCTIQVLVFMLGLKDVLQEGCVPV